MPACQRAGSKSRDRLPATVAAMSVPVARLMDVQMARHIVVVIVVPLVAGRMVVDVARIVPIVMVWRSVSCSIDLMRTKAVCAADIQMHVASADVNSKSGKAVGRIGRVAVGAHQHEGSNSG